MNRLFIISTVILSAFLFVCTTYAQRVNPRKGPDGCQKSLEMCVDDLNTCEIDLQTCEDNDQIFPGDGYSDPDVFGVSGHGSTLSYTDNSDGTFTDNNTGLMWEIKLPLDGGGGNCIDIPANRSVRCVNNIYTWTDTGNVDFTDPDGTLFMVFLDKLNNTCDGNGFDDCSVDADCAGIGNEICGLAGYRDWRLPNIKELQSILDYNAINPLITGFTSVPGPTRNTVYWSATTNIHEGSDVAWGVNFGSGVINFFNKAGDIFARAVRP